MRDEASTEPEVWRRLRPSVDTAASLHARAEGLLDALGPDTPPTIAWSQAQPRALVLGRGAAEPPIDLEAAAAAGLDVVRRRSGGGPVLWDRNLLGLDVWLPRGHALAPDDVVETYRWLGEALAAALRELGAPAQVVTVAQARADTPGDDDAQRIASLACFGALSPYEVVVDGRKVVGLAQVRRPQGALLQAGILLGFDAAVLAAVLSRGDVPSDAVAHALSTRMVGLLDLLPDLDARGLIECCERHLASRAGATWADGMLRETERVTWCKLSRRASRPA
jgi:lipoate-protein ligase A